MSQLLAPPGPADTRFQVIGAGISRTGTKTFTAALSILLSAPIHDGGLHSFVGSAPARARWRQLMKLGQKKEWTFAEKKKAQWLLAETLAGYAGTSDAPCIYFTPELMELYPDALVIATTRDAESWYKSLTRMQEMLMPWWVSVLLWPLPAVGSIGSWMQDMKRLNDARWIPDWERDTVDAHNEKLKEIVPKDKLFFYDVKDGWEPLCKILGKEVPKEPFPHENGAASAAKAFRVLYVAGAVAWSVILGLGGLVVVKTSAYLEGVS